jgi:hypothetical protein
MMQIPPATRRLFSAYAAESLVAEVHRPFLIGRLLEEGDSADLRWLNATLPESALGNWLETRGQRGLSRRGLAFWSLVLGRQARGEVSGKDLWPL